MTTPPGGSAAVPLYPYLLEPQFHTRVWGGRRLAEVLGVTLPPGAIGESWCMGAANRVLNGPLAGQEIGALVAAAPQPLLGRQVLASGRPDLPLLFKILDAQDRLSIQVHPGDRYAREVEHVPFGKTEAWYILDATPGAYVIHGFARPVTPEKVRSGLHDGSIVETLRKVELQAGDAILVPAGTVHAIGGGLLLGEIQENSDITYRLYDWGRPREMHVEQSLAVLDPRPPGFGKSTPLDVRTAGGTIRYLVACRYFVFQRLDVQERLELDTEDRSLQVLFGVAGEGVVEYAGGAEAFGAGQTVFVPAGLGPFRLIGAGWQVLRSYVPDLRADVAAPLLAAGYTAAQIGALGGAPGNELERAIAPACNV